MIMELGWILFIVGVGLLLLEIVFPGYFIVVPGTILTVNGVILIIAPELLTQPWSPVLFAIITLVVSAITIVFYRRLAPTHKPLATSMDSLTGKTGEVLREVVPNKIDGKVKIDEQVWSATSDSKIGVGERVVVTRVSGVHLFVTREKKV